MRTRCIAGGGGGLVRRGVKFVTQEGVLQSVASNGNHIPASANPSSDCRRCANLRKPEAELHIKD